jgi:hypothetical protein
MFSFNEKLVEHVTTFVFSNIEIILYATNLFPYRVAMIIIAPINQLSPKAPYLASPSRSIMNFASLAISCGRTQVILRTSRPHSGTFVGSRKSARLSAGKSVSTHFFSFSRHH